MILQQNLIIVHLMKKRPSFIIFTILLFILDQISKYFFYNQKVFSNISIIEPAFNTWISRSLPINLYFVIIVSIIMIVFLILLYKKNIIWKWATIFIIWWTIWNLIDRIYLWWVRDFIQIFNRFPIFNLADIFICTGTALIIIQELFSNTKNPQKLI